MASSEMALADWEAGLPCEFDNLSFCARCKPKPFPMEVVVSGGGSAFHRSVECKGLADGRRSVERRGGELATVRTVHREVAIGAKYSPCLLCFPEARGHS